MRAGATSAAHRSQPRQSQRRHHRRVRLDHESDLEGLAKRRRTAKIGLKRGNRINFVRAGPGQYLHQLQWLGREVRYRRYVQHAREVADRTVRNRRIRAGRIAWGFGAGAARSRTGHNLRQRAGFVGRGLCLGRRLATGQQHQSTLMTGHDYPEPERQPKDREFLDRFRSHDRSPPEPNHRPISPGSNPHSQPTG